MPPIQEWIKRLVFVGSKKEIQREGNIYTSMLNYLSQKIREKLRKSKPETPLEPEKKH